MPRAAVLLVALSAATGLLSLGTGSVFYCLGWVDTESVQRRCPLFLCCFAGPLVTRKDCLPGAGGLALERGYEKAVHAMFEGLACCATEALQHTCWYSGPSM